MKRIFLNLRAIYRTLLGFCPNCASDAPKVDTCPLCKDYREAFRKGEAEFPPDLSTRGYWLDNYFFVTNIQAATRSMLRKHKIQSFVRRLLR